MKDSITLYRDTETGEIYTSWRDVRINAIGQVYVYDGTLTWRAYVEFSGNVSEINNSGFDEMFNGGMVNYQLFTME